ncbi:MAG: class I SAM-dependent methyltransferase [Anaerolineales bacterium]
MTATNSLRSCNLCGEKNKLRLLYRRFGHSIIRCQSCSLVYLAQIPPKATLADLYAKTFFDSSKFSSGENSSGFRNAVARVQWALGLPEMRTQRWLDLGCATGDFMLAASKQVAEVHGSDVSAYAIQQAQARGLAHARAADFAELDYPEDSFDLVSMWDLIEHLPDARAALGKAWRLLQPGGYLAISTGDIDSVSARLSGRFWHLMIPPFHIYFFSQRTLRRYLEEAGFEQIKISYPGKQVPLDFLVEKALRLVSAKWSAKAAASLYRSPLGKIKLPLNFFDIMTISARKAAR